MKTILWVQNEEALTPDTFIIDGSLSHYSDTPDQNSAFAALTKASAKLRISPKARRIFSEQKGFTEQANFGISDDAYYIQGLGFERFFRESHRRVRLLFLSEGKFSMEGKHP